MDRRLNKSGRTPLPGCCVATMPVFIGENSERGPLQGPLRGSLQYRCNLLNQYFFSNSTVNKRITGPKIVARRAGRNPATVCGAAPALIAIQRRSITSSFQNCRSFRSSVQVRANCGHFPNGRAYGSDFRSVRGPHFHSLSRAFTCRSRDRPLYTLQKQCRSLQSLRAKQYHNMTLLSCQ